MENKTTHIDQFLNTKLKDLGQAPDKASYDVIFNHLQHLRDNTDFFIHAKLSELESSPKTNSMQVILEKVNTPSPIDSLLKDQLEHIQAIPSHESERIVLDAIKKKSYRRYYILALALMMGLTTTYLIQKNNNTSTNHSIASSVEISSKNLPRKNPDKINTMSDIEISSKKQSEFELNRQSNNSIILKSHQKTPKNSAQLHIEPVFTSNFKAEEKEVLNELIVNEKDIQQFYKLKNEIKLEQHYPFYAKEIEGLKKPHIWAVASPISFSLNIGIINKSKLSHNLNNNNAHKDEQNMFDQSIGKNNIGLSLRLGINYQIFNKGSLKMGMQVNRISSVNTIKYTHTDVPVYDTTGRLLGYLTRPASASPKVDENVKQEQTQISLPISLSYQFFKTKQFSLSFGMGLQMDLMNKMKGKFYNFQTEQMEDLKNSFKSNLQSGFLLHFSTPIKRQFSFELTMQLNRSKDKFELHGMQYNRINLNPNIQFGIRYTPYRFNK